ncbi:hypothetical protein KE513_00405 [Oscillospiraceae bacterium Marseille-Q3528]|nr:hypothetical protein [Oscillospiraceae bacterium Marseille-Q3528]
MTTIKIGKKEFNIKYGYEATVKNGIIKKLVSLGEENGNMESIEKILLLLPELLLAGLQKYHADEYGFDYKNSDQKEKQMARVYALLDEYFDGEDGDVEKLFGDLQNELLENGFLSKILRKESEKKIGKGEQEKEKN